MIHVIGSSKNKFLLTPFREKLVVDEPHDGDNIDNMNPWYCEITGLYRIWKYDKDDIIGLEHYRRYFLNDDNRILSLENAKEKLKDCDILLRRFQYKRYGLRDGFAWLESEDMMKYLIEFLYTCGDDKFAIFCLHELETQPEMSQCNMFIGKAEVVNKYCKWIFNALKNANFEKFKEKPRIFGFLTEFVFLAWLKYNGYKVKWCRTLTFDKDVNRVVEVTPGE